MLNIANEAVAGWAFVAGAIMIWAGRMPRPARIGAFFKTDDFGKVRDKFSLWIWLYRLQMFGYIVAVMAFVALGALFAGTSASVITWPGVAVAAAGLLVTTLANAFYYHFGAWGAMETAGKSDRDLSAYVDSLRVITHYMTCWTRFGRVFFGLGITVLAIGLLIANSLPLWLPISLGILGLAPMLLTMAFPDNLEYFEPLFHLHIAWFLAAGITLITI